MVRRQIQKRESKRERQETYAKRSKGLLKKVSELSILCDVDVGLITFAPNGKLKHYSNQPKIEKVLQEFIQCIPNMPEKEREKFVRLQTSQDIIDMINKAAGPDDVADQQGSDAPQREEVNSEIIELQSKLMLLQEQERMLDPTMGTLNSEQEREKHINRLRENALIMIAKRKEELMSVQGSYNLTPGTNPSLRSVQELQAQASFYVTKFQEEASSIQQQLKSRRRSSIPGAPPSLSMKNMHSKLPIQDPQPRIDTGMWDPQQGGKQLQVHGVPPQRGQQYSQQPPQHGMAFSGGSEQPSSNLFSQPGGVSLHGVLDTGMWGRQQGGKQLQVHGVPPQRGQQYSQQPPQHGMAFSGGSEQPSSNLFSQPGGVSLHGVLDTGMWGRQQGGKQLQVHEVPPQRGQQYSQQPPQHGMAFSGGSEQPSSNLSSQPGGVSLHGVEFSNEVIDFLSDLISEDA